MALEKGNMFEETPAPELGVEIVAEAA